MSNGSLKEQLSAVASQFADPSKPKHDKFDKPAHVQHKPARAAAPAHRHQGSKHPAPKTQKPKPRWLEYAQYGVELLRVYFPGAFKPMSEVKALKVGIKEDLLKRLSTLENIVTEDKACMVKSLSYYVNTQSYHKCVVEGAERIDLDGQPAGIITAEEAKYSVEKQQAKLQAKKAGISGVKSENKEEELVE